MSLYTSVILLLFYSPVAKVFVFCKICMTWLICLTCCFLNKTCLYKHDQICGHHGHYRNQYYKYSYDYIFQLLLLLLLVCPFEKVRKHENYAK